MSNFGFNELHYSLQDMVGDLNLYKSSKDANGIFVINELKRADGTLAIKSTLSGGTSPQYTIQTVEYYKADGTTVYLTKVFTLSYDVDGDLISKVVT